MSPRDEQIEDAQEVETMKESSPVFGATVAGGIAGAVAAVSLAVLSAALVARLASRHFPAMMARMMGEGGCSAQMCACMERCGCGAGDGAAE